ncbi:MAG TPA: sugar phosphate isomerase/epimerase, partial [Gemmatales bacterium]|nr:sugar phosphate isomerase/epimerase [Gemmatales bacterium]
MTRMLALYTGAFLDIPLEAVCAKASEWGYAGLEIACSGEHFSVPRAVSESGYCQSILEMLEQHELQLVALNHRTVGQAITDTLDRRHQEALPEWIWGDGH